MKKKIIPLALALGMVAIPCANSKADAKLDDLMNRSEKLIEETNENTKDLNSLEYIEQIDPDDPYHVTEESYKKAAKLEEELKKIDQDKLTEKSREEVKEALKYLHASVNAIHVTQDYIDRAIELGINAKENLEYKDGDKPSTDNQQGKVDLSEVERLLQILDHGLPKNEMTQETKNILGDQVGKLLYITNKKNPTQEEVDKAVKETKEILISLGYLEDEKTSEENKNDSSNTKDDNKDTQKDNKENSDKQDKKNKDEKEEKKSDNVKTGVAGITGVVGTLVAATGGYIYTKKRK